MLIDSHCHLDFNDFDEDFDEIMARAREAGVTAHAQCRKQYQRT